MTHRDMLFKWLFYALASALFLVLQGLLFNHIFLFNVHPFVFPILAATLAVLESPQESFAYALVLGFLCDLAIPGMFPCFYTVSFLLIALLSSIVADKIIVPGFWCALVCGALSIVVCGLFNTLILHYRHAIPYADAFVLIGRELLLSLVLIPPVYFLFRKINLRISQNG